MINFKKISENFPSISFQILCLKNFFRQKIFAAFLHHLKSRKIFLKYFFFTFVARKISAAFLDKIKKSKKNLNFRFSYEIYPISDTNLFLKFFPSSSQVRFFEHLRQIFWRTGKRQN
jgi:hypothetical protein